MAAPAWTSKAQRVLIPLIGLDLVIQYVAGVLTNAYAPASGFTDSTDFGAYDFHAINAYVLGILLIIGLVVVGLSRNYRNLAAVAVAFVAFLLAAIGGMAFVGSTPNAPWATTMMGVAFLVAFSAVMALNFRLMPATPGPANPPVRPATVSTGGS